MSLNLPKWKFGTKIMLVIICRRSSNITTAKCFEQLFHNTKSHILERSNMAKNQDRMVYKKDGKWVNKRNDAGRASSVHDTQKDAIDAATQMLQNQGGGELTTKGVDGRIRSKETIAPGNDPNPPKDTEH